MHIQSIDHLVLTVNDIANTVDFYTEVLGMTVEEFAAEGEMRTALRFGKQKINLHAKSDVFLPRAKHPLAGSGDLCFLTDIDVQEVIAHLTKVGIEVLEGPVERTGAMGKLISVYVRDPDQNLIEISNQIG